MPLGLLTVCPILLTFKIFLTYFLEGISPSPDRAHRRIKTGNLLGRRIVMRCVHPTWLGRGFVGPGLIVERE